MFARKFFILAPAFHGVTMVGRLIDAHPLAVCLGDTYPNNSFDQICGCGSLVSDCLFWQDIKAQVDAARFVDTPFMLPLYPRLLGGSIDRVLSHRLPISILKRAIPKDRGQAFVSDFRRFVSAVYGHFAEDSPQVFVDGFKSATRVKGLLACGERIDGILHVVRDPADFVKSTMNKTGNGLMRLVEAARSWRRDHREIEKLGARVPYLRIGYEELCEKPDAVLRRIFEYMSLQPMTIDELRRHSDRPWHFMGNSSMFDFDWTIRAKRYALSGTERYLIRQIARPAVL